MTWLLSVEGHEHGRRVQQAAAGAEGAGIEAAFVTAAGRLTQLPWDQAAAVRFENLAPVSAFPVVPGRRWGPDLWGPDWWWSATTGRHVVHGSAAMRTQLMVLDRNPDVTGLAARPVRLLWREPDGRVRSWVPQLFALYADGTGLLAGCPSSPAAGGGQGAAGADGPGSSVRARVGRACRRLEPPPAVVAANLRWPAGYRHPRGQGPPRLRAAPAEVFAVSCPPAGGAAAVGDPLQVLPAVCHALWCGHLTRLLMSRCARGALVCADAERSGGDVGKRLGAGGGRGRGECGGRHTR
ncbi:TnsA-like heteromeric transposase endonuclease subunit [Streptomyces sp. NBC_01187]|uniref:TnsA-like heteromeric transposase endonuclease subunit n=2 Tax=unclassified Streptomyces TaxID=2593676 RepID=UPI0038660349|nr:TnsA-like heteromeric transposase endonuclease subunit [Streptomyces sp. NBC_01187]WSS46022.1 TnsA-like heteromeric transposase endonuclease subunit [Streptomyces sp. NBC_01187]